MCSWLNGPLMGSTQRLLIFPHWEKESSHRSSAVCIHTYLGLLFLPRECEIEIVKAPGVVIGKSNPSKDKSAGTKSTSN